MSDQAINSLAYYFYKARVVAEMATPLSIATGQAKQGFDNAIVRDANGLPTIPGTSIAGVLRHLFWSLYGEEQAKQLFGFEQQDQRAVSKVKVSFACVHNGANQVIEGLDYALMAKDDPIIAHLLQPQPLKRDRVRLTERGVAADQGKFDRVMALAGTRFTFELSFNSQQKQESCWYQLLHLLYHPQFRLGGSTRAGLGALRIISLHQQGFDLRDQAAAGAFRHYPHSLAVAHSLPIYHPPKKGLSELSCELSLSLQAEAGLRMGQGASGFNTLTIKDKAATVAANAKSDDTRQDTQQEKKPPVKTKTKKADGLPQSEQVIVWRQSGEKIQAELKHMLVLPGSSIKGSLAHRVDYYYRCLTGQFSDGFVSGKESGNEGGSPVGVKYDDGRTMGFTEAVQARCQAVDSVFGAIAYIEKNDTVNGADNEEKQVGQTGIVCIDDIYLETITPSQTNQGGENKDDKNRGVTTYLRQYNSIDRFTGGTRDGALFSDELCWRPQFNVVLRFDQRKYQLLDRALKQSIQLAINDLLEGHLALGAGFSKGHGLLSGKLEGNVEVIDGELQWLS